MTDSGSLDRRHLLGFLGAGMAYRIVLRRRDGQIVWAGERLSPGPAGTLAVGLDSALLSPGDYRLFVEQERGVPVARFTFRVDR